MTPTILTEKLNELSQAQRERLAYIEFKIYFFGKVGRQDLMIRFGVAPAGATRDFAAYRELASKNIELDNVSKMYVIREGFVPIFEHVPERVMIALSNGFGDGINPTAGALIPCEMTPSWNRLSIDILAPISRGISLGKIVRIKYFSDSSGLSEREIAPFSFATDGLRWHVRAFDRKQRKFIDFVLSRMDEAVVVDDAVVLKEELPAQDHQWNRIVEMDLVPHPDRKSEVVRRDYEMVDGALHITVRAAMAGYILRQWHVDCSPDHCLADKAFRLWLQDPLVLYGVESAFLAPGYKKEIT